MGAAISRSAPTAVIADVDVVAERAVRLAGGLPVEDVTGAPITVRAESICIHSDTPGAVQLAVRVRQGLAAAGIDVAAFA